MTIKSKPRAERKSRSKQGYDTLAKGKAKSPDKRLSSAFKRGQKSAKRGGTTIVIVPGKTGKFKVYGGKGDRIPAVGSKSTASGIAGRLGAKADVFREVDKLIDYLRSRKKIG